VDRAKIFSVVRAKKKYVVQLLLKSTLRECLALPKKKGAS
jgi:hypothetical protein